MILYTVSWVNTTVYNLLQIDIIVVFYKSFFLIQNPRCPAPAEYYTFNLYSQHHLLRIFIIWKSHKENVGAISEKKRIVCMNEMKSFMGVKCLIIVSMQTYLKSITVRTDSLLSHCVIGFHAADLITTVINYQSFCRMLESQNSVAAAKL